MPRLLGAASLAFILALSAQTSAEAERPSWATRAAASLCARGAREAARGDPTGALVSYSEALRVDPSHGPAWLGLGEVREQVGDLPEAELVYSRAIRIAGIAPIALERRARLRYRAGRKAEALQDLEDSLEIDPSSAARARLLGTWHVELGAWPAALAAARREVSLLEARPASHELTEARTRVRALTLLTREMDPVTTGGRSHPSWVRRMLAVLGS
jgi:tetratricopeptide (TPR) repeat protein